MKESLKFFEREEIEVIKQTVVKKGIAHYCCKHMKKACEDFKTNDKDRYSNERAMATSRIYDKNTNKIGLEVHSVYASYDYTEYYNYMEFKYCPFCGTKINGYVEEDEE